MTVVVRHKQTYDPCLKTKCNLINKKQIMSFYRNEFFLVSKSLELKLITEQTENQFFTAKFSVAVDIL